MNADVQIAQTILDQLGGSQFVALTGARNFVAGADLVQFSLPSGAKSRINKVRITLDPSDTYTVEFFNLNLRAGSCSLVSAHSDIYCDSLQDLFERETGLYVTLFSRRTQ